MSEDMKLRNLRQRIRGVARNERNGLLIILMGVFLINGGLIISVLGNSRVAYIAGIFFIASGIFSTALGFLVSVRYARQYNNLLNELETA